MAKKQTTIRISEQVDNMLKEMADKRQTSQANIIEDALRKLYADVNMQ